LEDNPLFKRLLIPLDGSRLAESALQPAAVLNQKLGAAVTLIHVIEKNAPSEVHGERHLTSEDEACRYLDEISLRAFDPQADVECHVHTEEVRNVARSITNHVAEFEPDLILMCAHGNGGFRDVMVGTIPQQVIGSAKTSVLLLQPGEASMPQAVAFQRFLVGLDGDAEHERSLNVAGELALKMGAALHLVHVVQTVGTLQGKRAAAASLLPATTLAMLDMLTVSAREYLEEKASVWRAQGLAVTIDVRRGAAEHELARAAADAGCDLIVLGTHGRAGMGAFWSGSTAPKVIGQTRLPILFVPAHG
jgi:nucleotide-binding universal stress UspA family protein